MAANLNNELKTGDCESMDSPVSKTRLIAMYEELIFIKWPKLKGDLRPKEENRKLPYEVRVPEVELDFDPEYSNELPEIFEEEIDEIEKELEYDIQVAHLRVDKLNRFLMAENILSTVIR